MCEFAGKQGQFAQRRNAADGLAILAAIRGGSIRTTNRPVSVRRGIDLTGATLPDSHRVSGSRGVWCVGASELGRSEALVADQGSHDVGNPD